jgi:hypothetical protein
VVAERRVGKGVDMFVARMSVTKLTASAPRAFSACKPV